MAPIAAGIRFYSAYPMSPSTFNYGIFLAAKSETAGIVVEQAEDEIAAINMAIGASFAARSVHDRDIRWRFSALKVEGLALQGWPKSRLSLQTFSGRVHPQAFPPVQSKVT